MAFSLEPPSTWGGWDEWGAAAPLRALDLRRCARFHWRLRLPSNTKAHPIYRQDQLRNIYLSPAATVGDYVQSFQVVKWAAMVHTTFRGAIRRNHSTCCVLLASL